MDRWNDEDCVSTQHTLDARDKNFLLPQIRQSHGSFKIWRHSLWQTQNCEFTTILAIKAGINGTETGREAKNLTFFCSLSLAHMELLSSWSAYAIAFCPLSICQLLTFSTSLPRPLDRLTRNLVWCIGVTSRSIVAKIIPILSLRWPPWLPSWKSILNFFSWTKRLIDSKLSRK